MFNGFLTKRGREEFLKAIDTVQAMCDAVRYRRTFSEKNLTERRSELRGIESLLSDTVDEMDRCRQQLREWQKRSMVIGLIQIATTVLALFTILVVHFFG